MISKKLLALLAIGVFLAAPSFAATNSVTFNTTTPIPSTLTDWNGSLSFPQFNPSAGTLTMVELDLSGSMSTTLSITNCSPTGSHGSASTELQYTVQDQNGNLNVPEIDLISTAYNYNLSGGGFVTSGLINKAGRSSDQYTAGNVLAEFTGTGSTSLGASTFTQTLLANTGGNTTSSQVTNAQLTGSVTYFYNLPEPSGIVSLACLLLPTAFFLKRRKA